MGGLAEWQEPQAGMFAWVKLCGGIKDADEILDKLKEEKVVVVPGTIHACMLSLKLQVILMMLLNIAARPCCNPGLQIGLSASTSKQLGIKFACASPAMICPNCHFVVEFLTYKTQRHNLSTRAQVSRTGST